MSLEEKLQQATGAAKEALGKVTGDKSTETEGSVEKNLAKAKEVLENVKEGVEGAVEGIKNTFNKQQSLTNKSRYNSTVATLFYSTKIYEQSSQISKNGFSTYVCNGYVGYTTSLNFSLVTNPGSASKIVGMRFTIVAHV